ncbi:hypothetical protein TNCV_1463522 [Trichonephila clavipes]|uniref:Uncharacterized protein n=1 Tax=Trichonephila clavipes TaxID=2585209 RepID=A0A8X6V9X9_TRICX|nr:hypothetical protein TNCV_1463522 [Trichonephila clavipes]
MFPVGASRYLAIVLTSTMEDLMYTEQADMYGLANDEDLVARISEDATRVWEIPGISLNVYDSHSTDAVKHVKFRRLVESQEIVSLGILSKEDFTTTFEKDFEEAETYRDSRRSGWYRLLHPSSKRSGTNRIKPILPQDNATENRLEA